MNNPVGSRSHRSRARWPSLSRRRDGDDETSLRRNDYEARSGSDNRSEESQVRNGHSAQPAVVVSGSAVPIPCAPSSIVDIKRYADQLSSLIIDLEKEHSEVDPLTLCLMAGIILLDELEATRGSPTPTGNTEPHEDAAYIPFSFLERAAQRAQALVSRLETDRRF